MRVRRATVGLVAVASLVWDAGPRAQQRVQPTFRSGVDLVTVNAVVVDHKGRPKAGLSRDDFEVYDSGVRRPLDQFRSERGPVSLALLFDVSGSMQVASKIGSARQAAEHLLAWLDPASHDEAALFSFDTELREVQPFTRDLSDVERALARVRPFGATSLRDAIAQAARRVAGRTELHRAVVVLTDGLDTSSRLSPGAVSSIASAIHVPVYLVAVVSPLDHPGAETAVGGADRAPIAGDLVALARDTGGDLFVVSAPAHASVAARQILAELRQQYVLAFEPGDRPGWHPLEIRIRGKHLTVRARSGYVAGTSRRGS